MSSRASAGREVTTYLVVAYGLAPAIALGLPHANINLLLSVRGSDRTVTR